LLQRKTNGGDRITPRPNMLAREVALASRKLPGKGDSTLACERADS